jgi:NAD(P)H-flavin reductase
VSSEEGKVLEVYLAGGRAAARLVCLPKRVPAPGQYLLIHAFDDSDFALATPVFNVGATSDGFLAAAPLPADWHPGTRLSLRGPLGRGFDLPISASRVALAALGGNPVRLLPLLDLALGRDMAVVLLCETQVEDLPSAVEVQPLSALPEVCVWADYLALDLPRSALSGLSNQLGLSGGEAGLPSAQALVDVPMPCGALADCGVCAVEVKRGWKLACKDGPVYELSELL